MVPKWSLLGLILLYCGRSIFTFPVSLGNKIALQDPDVAAAIQPNKHTEVHCTVPSLANSDYLIGQRRNSARLSKRMQTAHLATSRKASSHESVRVLDEATVLP